MSCKLLHEIVIEDSLRYYPMRLVPRTVQQLGTEATLDYLIGKEHNQPATFSQFLTSSILINISEPFTITLLNMGKRKVGALEKIEADL